MIYQVMLSQSPINLSIMNKIKIKLFSLPQRVWSNICLKSFMGANPHNYYVIKIGSWFPKDCKMSHAVVSPHSMPPRNQSKKTITQHFYQKNHFHMKSTGKCHGPACPSDAWKFNQKFQTPRKLVLKFGWSMVRYPCSSFICNVLNISYHSSRCLASSYLGGIWYLIHNT